MQNAFSAYLDELKPLLVSTPPAIADAHFDHLARRLFAAQFEAVPPYRNLCLARHITPDSLSHWSAIPPVPTSSFQEFEWTSLARDQRTRAFLSSGTTGSTPSRHFHNDNSITIYERSILAGARPILFRNNRTRIRMLFLTPGPEAAPHSSLVHMFDTFRREWGAPASEFVGRIDTAERWTVAIDPVIGALSHGQSAGQPVVVLGTAFSFVDLLDQLSARKLCFTLPPGSWLLETGGYKGRSRALPKPELYRLLTDSFGVLPASIVSEYGMCELSSQAYDHIPGEAEPEQGRCFRFPPWVRALIINPNTNAPAAPGETGLLRIFDLANVRSIMAIQTKDLAAEQDHGFELLGRAATTEARGCSLLSP
jgi:hypothetical protein